MQRKVVTPNDFTDLDEIIERLAAFETRYNALAEPFDWTFGRDDLDKLLARIEATTPRRHKTSRACRRLRSAAMPIPEVTRAALARRLDTHRGQRWPQLSELNIRYRAAFAYLDGSTDGDEPMPLCRLRYLGSPDNWGFAIYLASKNGYEDSLLPNGSFTGTPEQALDCACGLYLNDVTAWTDALDQEPRDSPKNL